MFVNIVPLFNNKVLLMHKKQTVCLRDVIIRHQSSLMNADQTDL